jgi:hypothetical protein
MIPWTKKEKNERKKNRLSVVAQAFNSTEIRFKASPRLGPLKKKNSRDPISSNGWTKWHMPVITTTPGSTNWKTSLQANLGIK